MAEAVHEPAAPQPATPAPVVAGGDARAPLTGPEQVLALQRTAGNRATVRALARQPLTSHAPVVASRTMGDSVYVVVNDQSVAEGMVGDSGQAQVVSRFDAASNSLDILVRVPGPAVMALTPGAEEILAGAAAHYHLRIERQGTTFQGERAQSGWVTVAELGSPGPAPTPPVAPPPAPAPPRAPAPAGPNRQRVDELLQHLREQRWDVDSLAAALTDADLGSLSAADRLALIAYIGRGYVVGDEDEATIIRLIATTPAGERRTVMEGMSASLLQDLESAIDGEEYRQYHAALRELMLRARTPDELIADMEHARVLPWADPGLLEAIGHGHIHYDEPVWTEQGKLRISGYYAPLSFMRLGPVEFAPDELIGVYFLTDDEALGAHQGQTLYMPATSFLSLYNKQYHQELTTAVNVALAVGGAAGIAGATTTLGRIIAVIEAALAVAAPIVEEYRSTLSRSQEGRTFLTAWDRVQTLIVIYTLARAVANAPRAFRALRDAYRSIRATLSSGEAAQLERQLEQVGVQATDAERELQAAAPQRPAAGGEPPGPPPSGGGEPPASSPPSGGGAAAAPTGGPRAYTLLVSGADGAVLSSQQLTSMRFADHPNLAAIEESLAPLNTTMVRTPLGGGASADVVMVRVIGPDGTSFTRARIRWDPDTATPQHIQHELNHLRDYLAGRIAAVDVAAADAAAYARMQAQPVDELLTAARAQAVAAGPMSQQDRLVSLGRRVVLEVRNHLRDWEEYGWTGSGGRVVPDPSMQGFAEMQRELIENYYVRSLRQLMGTATIPAAERAAVERAVQDYIRQSFPELPEEFARATGGRRTFWQAAGLTAPQ